MSIDRQIDIHRLLVTNKHTPYHKNPLYPQATNMCIQTLEPSYISFLCTYIVKFVSRNRFLSTECLLYHFESVFMLCHTYKMHIKLSPLENAESSRKWLHPPPETVISLYNHSGDFTKTFALQPFSISYMQYNTCTSMA